MRPEAVEAEKTWNRVGQRYTNAWDNPLTGDAERQRLTAIFEQHNVFTPGAIILDLACGKGTLLTFAQNGRIGFVTELDVSPVMLAGAKAKADELGMADQVKFVVADAQETGLPGNAYDTVIIFNALPHFKSDIPGLIGEISRVLKPNGRLIIAHDLSREALNKKHREREEFKEDLVPSKESLAQAFSQRRLQAEEWIDTPSIDYILVTARKLGTDTLFEHNEE
ncbi:MAG TPA: class I SAM-dependent methyltransferase [Patescibacteria group bacterium]|nr:class I SAM-dependent methyltransferase [Patescibacteria group bacterium]